MKVKWQIDDGYAGGSRYQYTEIDDYSIQECETDDQLERLIEECIQDDFEQKVCADWDVESALTEAKKIQLAFHDSTKEEE